MNRPEEDVVASQNNPVKDGKGEVGLGMEDGELTDAHRPGVATTYLVQVFIISGIFPT